MSIASKVREYLEFIRMPYEQRVEVLEKMRARKFAPVPQNPKYPPFLIRVQAMEDIQAGQVVDIINGQARKARVHHDE